VLIVLPAESKRRASPDVRCGAWLCENSEIEKSDRKIRLAFVTGEKKNSGKHCWTKTIEKTIYALLAPTFLHSPGHELPSLSLIIRGSLTFQ
jgi:hypothetical protein